MKYGCIGEHLKHSFSKEIHNYIADYEYELKELSIEEFDSFMKKRDFCAINVTIPYKELVLPYLHFIDENAKAIGAVNTVVNRDGKLYGYNTDFYGMTELLRYSNIELCGKKVAVLGTGGTSKTAKAVAKNLLASEIITVSRSGKNGAVTYEELYDKHCDTQVIINTTPVGMYPNIFGKALELSSFPKLCGVIDAVYNPLKTPLVLDAKAKGVSANGGLYMLVAQAVLAAEIFTDTAFDKSLLDGVFEKVLKEKQNVVLIGMPASGKSTVGKLLAEKLGREFIDTDILIEQKTGLKISEIFKLYGEEKFREIESELVREVSAKNSAVIATGGGVVLKKGNMDALSQNGRIYFIDRPPENLTPTADRPLALTKQEIEKRYNERYDLYVNLADVKINANCDAVKVAQKIMGDFLK